MYLKSKATFAYLPSVVLVGILGLGFLLLFSTKEMTSVSIFTNQEFWDAFLYGTKISFFVVFFATLCFLLIYYLLFLLRFQYNKELTLWLFFLQIPLFIPYAFCALLFFVLFFSLGTSSEVLPFLLGAPEGVIMAYVYKVTPFLLLICMPHLILLKQDEINLHTIYSANSFLFFYKILLKRVLKVYFLGSFIIFAYVLNAYEIPFILGENSNKMPSILVYEQSTQLGALSLQKAYMMSLTYFVLALLFMPLFYFFYALLKRVL